MRTAVSVHVAEILRDAGPKVARSTQIHFEVIPDLC